MEFVNALKMTKSLLSEIDDKTVRDRFKKKLETVNDYLSISKIRDNVIKYIDKNKKEKEKVELDSFEKASFEFLKTLCADILSLPDLPEYYTKIEKSGVFPVEEAKEWNKNKDGKKRKAIHVQTIIKKGMIIASADPQLGKTKFTICLAIKSLIEGRTPIIVTRALTGDMYKLVKDIENISKQFNDYMKINNVKKKFEITTIHGENESLIKSIEKEYIRIVVVLGNDCQLSKVYNVVKDKPSTYDLLIDEIDFVDYGTNTKTSKVLTKLKEGAYQPFGITATPLDALCSEKELKTANMIRLKRPDDYRGFVDFQVKLLKHDPKTIGLSTAKTYQEILDSDGNLEPFINWFSKRSPDWSWNNKKYYPRICLFKISHVIENQNQLYEGILRDYGDKFVVIVYNGEGIRMNYEGNILGKSVNPDEYVELSIPDVLQYLKDNGGEKKFPRIIIIAGKLAGRCISFVSRDYDWHLTDMYYNPSKSTPIPEMIQSAGRLCGRNRGKAPNLLLHTTENVSNALYTGFNCTNEIISRAIASPLMEDDGNEVNFRESIMSVPMNTKKFPKNRNMTSKVKVKKSEFNLVKTDDGGVDIEEYKYTEFNEKKQKKEIDTSVGNCKLIIIEKLGNTSKEYYEKIVKYLKENKNKWITKSECISSISKNNNEINVITSATWHWHSKDNMYNENVNEKHKGLLFKLENNTWYVRYN